MAIEAETYEPARCDSRMTLATAFDPGNGVAVVAEFKVLDEWVIVGSALAAALESFEHVDGPKQDGHLGKSDTAYSIAVTIHPAHRGRGLGHRLKQAQLRAARELQTISGHHRYRFMTGRNRVGLADSMTHLNRAFGAYEVETFSDQYGEADAQAIYYRIPLQQYAPPPSQYDGRIAHEWHQTICQPLATPPESLIELRNTGGLFGPAVTKITVCNYITPAIVRAVEWVAALNPNHPHLYLTSCRGELIDKTIRTLKHHRTEAVAAIGLHGGYLGHTTAGCRALSDPAVHKGGSAARTWPRIPHPATHGVAAMVTALKQTVASMGGPAKVLGLFVEPIQERTGYVLDDEAWVALDALRKETGIPLISIETASAYYRGQTAAFASDKCDIEPDIRAWWPGGQTGFIHLQAQYFVPKPLTMVSTWDGDELSMIRAHYNLMAIRRMELEPAFEIMTSFAKSVEQAGYQIAGRGLYYVLHLNSGATQFVDELAAQGLNLRAFPNGTVAIAPPVDITVVELESQLKKLTTALNRRG